MNNMQFSYSRVSTYESCPYRFKLQYLDGLKTLENYEADNALYIGSMLHKAIETDVETATKEYYDMFPIITDSHINEAMKVEALAPKVKWLLPRGEHEVELNCDEFKGFIDYLAGDEIFDFKYSNNVDRYMESAQLHVYKYYTEKLLGIEVKYLYYVFVPKVQIRQKKKETLEQFRSRLRSVLSEQQPKVMYVEYDHSKVEKFLETIEEIKCATEFPKNETKLCDWCQYKNYCLKGETYDLA